MKNFFLPVLVSIVFIACNNKPATTADTSQMQTDLMNADKAWNTLAGEVGMQKSFEQNYAEDVVMLQSGKQPVLGLAAVKNEFAAHPDSSKGLSWAAEKAEVSQSGELGYTWGKWQFKSTTAAGTDTTEYGVYATVWRKQADGSWKAILDQGNNTPKPE